jgi:transcriptional regulator with XRE-family HTH domain
VGLAWARWRVGSAGGPGDTEIGIGWRPEIPPPATPQPLGAGSLILVVRELTGLSQRALAAEIRSSQPSLATLESGNRLPTIRTLLRIADATGFELVLGLRRSGEPTPDHRAIEALGFALLGSLHANPEDDLADYVVFREPKPWEGPG